MSDRDLVERLTIAVQALSAATEPDKAILILFNPSERPEQHRLFGDVAAGDLIPVLKAMLERLESGDLRMPITGGEPWVDSVVEG